MEPLIHSVNISTKLLRNIFMDIQTSKAYFVVLENREYNSVSLSQLDSLSLFVTAYLTVIS